MKTKTTLITITLAALFSTSQAVMATNEDSAGYDLLLNIPTNQSVTTHSEVSTLNGNLGNAATYGALYNSIASPVANSDNGHGIHEHKFVKVGLPSIQESTSHELIGDPFYFDTNR